MLVHSSDRDAWLAARRELITGSDVARLLCEGYAKTEAEKAGQRGQLIMEKAGLAEEWEGDERTELAGMLEEAVIGIARKRFGWDIRPHGALVVDSVCTRLGATPDSIVKSPWGDATVNVKISSAQPPEDCKPRKDGSPSTAAYANGVPLYYQLQLQAEMAVLGLQHSALLVLHHGNGLKLRSYYVARHEGVIARIRREVDKVWREIEALREGRLSA
jgi:predicted phage-related endonuclease